MSRSTGNNFTFLLQIIYFFAKKTLLTEIFDFLANKYNAGTGMCNVKCAIHALADPGGAQSGHGPTPKALKGAIMSFGPPKTNLWVVLNKL